jgi:hypothetical protein
VPKRGKIDIGDLNPKTAEPVHEEAASIPESARPTPPPDFSPEQNHGEQTQGRKESGGPAYDPPPRRPRAERPDTFDFSSWLLEGVVGIAEELRHNDLGLPEEFWTHAYAARKEALLAARSLLDVAIERCEETSPPSARRKARKQRGNVNIDFKEKE